LPAGSFDTSNISGTVGTYFFYYFNYNGALTSLPVGSFDTSSISGTVGDYFFAYFNYSGALTSLPAGSFDTSSITTVGAYYFAYSFYNNQLSRATILQVASKRSLNQTNLNKSNVFYQTFYGNATTGSVTETDIPQLALNPSDPRNTFAGTNLSTDSTNWINWGFS
jgi:surface protein